MTVPRSYLMRYCVIGYKDGEKYQESFNNGRDAYIFETYLKRQGYKNVQIMIK